jgi:hypothetical protein
VESLAFQIAHPLQIRQVLLSHTQGEADMAKKAKKAKKAAKKRATKGKRKASTGMLTSAVKTVRRQARKLGL